VADTSAPALSPAILAPTYQLEEREGWQLLARHFQLTEGFSFILVLAPDDWGVAFLRERLPDILPQPGAVQRVAFDPSAAPASLAESLLSLPSSPENMRVLWIDADPGDPESFPARDEAWRHALARLNRYRNLLQARFSCTLALAGPVRLLAILRAAAPDLWSIRSGVFRIEPPGAKELGLAILPVDERRSLRGLDVTVSGDPAITLAEADKIRGKPGREFLLAELLQRAGRQAVNHFQWDLAIRCLQEAFCLQEAHGGDPAAHFSIANDLACAFADLAKHDRALHYAERALETAEQHFGENHPTTATALNNLAALLQDTNRLAEAEPLLRRALAIDEHSFGPEHPTVATALNNLAQLLKATNRLAEAEPLSWRQRMILLDSTRRTGYEHPHLRAALENYASILETLGRSEEEIVAEQQKLLVEYGVKLE